MKRKKADEVTLLAALLTAVVMNIEALWELQGPVEAVMVTMIVFWIIHFLLSEIEYWVRLRESRCIKQRKRARWVAAQNRAHVK